MEPKPAELQDIITYTPETYFSDEEVALIRQSFNGPTGSKLLKVIRKALLPTISDPDLPVEELGKDMFMALVDFTKLQDGEVKPVAMGLQLTAKIIVGSLIHLKTLANVQEETKEEAARRNSKNATR